MKLFYIFPFLLSTLLLQGDEDLFDGSLEDIMLMETELNADVGSRSGSKSFLDSIAPVDVITSTQIESSGLTSLSDVLRYFVAGFNAPETSVADGSDHVRTFTLRGMGADQILVLINGKRVHTSALLHVNGTIGRGSSNVDLDTIALRSIEKVEILRDGAAAQYGSDAISGVINIILKGSGHNNSISVSSGMRKAGDGEQVSVDSFVSIPLKYEGFINLTLQAKGQNKTSRAGDDLRLEIPIANTYVGIPDSKSFLATLNIEVPQNNNMILYTNSTFNYRDSESSAFFRVPDSTRTLYSDGFLPLLNAKILNYSFTAGVKTEILDGLFIDLSNVYGYNKIEYSLKDTMNYSLGDSSQTSFNNGSLSFIQNTTNLDLKKSTDSFELAGGLELRYEDYKIEAGEYASYVDSGSQGFAGYRVENEVNQDRVSYAGYLEGLYNFSDSLSSQTALRYENYSDFGATTNAKFALKYKLTQKLILRGSLSSGFRAPSLAQSNYSHTSTFGGLIEGTFKPNDSLSQELGAKDLKAEKSKHFTIGGVYQPSKDVYFMLDYFFIDVEDRIMLSNEYTLNASQQSQYGVNKARFFTNAVDTQTQGFDIKLQRKYSFENSSSLDFGIWYNYSKNKVIAFNNSSITRENSFEQVDRVENGQPKESLKILSSYEIKDIKSTLNINRFGSYRQVRDDIAYAFKSAWSVDLDISYKVMQNFNVAVGGNNIFDTVPNKWDGLEATEQSAYYGYNGIKPYSRYSPFGYSGAYYYFRASYEF